MARPRLYPASYIRLNLHVEAQTLWYNRIIGSLRLEITSKVKSNLLSNTSVPNKPCHKVPHFIFSRDWDSATFLGRLFQCFTTLPVKKFFLMRLFFLISSLNLVQLQAVSLCPADSYLREEAGPQPLGFLSHKPHSR